MLVMALWFFGNLQTPKDKDFAFTRIRPVAHHRQRPHRADGFARAQFAAGNPRETDAQHRAVEGLEPAPENHSRHRVAGQRDDEPRRRRRLAGLPRGQSGSDLAAETAGQGRGEKIRRQALFLEPDPARRSTPSTRKTSACRKSRPPTAPPTKTPSPRCRSGCSFMRQLRNTVQPADAQNWPAELAAYEQTHSRRRRRRAGAAGRAEIRPDQFQHFRRLSSRNSSSWPACEPPLVLPPNGASAMAAHGRRSARRAAGQNRRFRRQHPRLCPNGRRAGGQPAGRIQRRIARFAFADREQPAQGDRQGARRSVLQPDGAVLQRDGHLRPRRIAGDVFRGSICPKRCAAPPCGSSGWRLSSTPPAWFIAWCWKAGRR